MKKAVIVAAAISLALAGSAFAEDIKKSETFEQKKASISKRLEERANKTKEAHSCVQAAKNMDELKVCKEKHMKSMTDMEKTK